MTTDTRPFHPAARRSTVEIRFLLAGSLSLAFAAWVGLTIDGRQGLILGVLVLGLWSLGSVLVAVARRTPRRSPIRRGRRVRRGRPLSLPDAPPAA